MGWTVFGGARPAVHLIVVESLLNIKAKRFFNAAKWAGPWQGMLKSAAQPWTWMFLHGWIVSKQKSSSTPWTELGRVWGSTAQQLVRMWLKSFILSRWDSFSTPWNDLDGVWGSTIIRLFERCWKSAQYQNETILQRRELSWAVTGDVGERGPAMNLMVYYPDEIVLPHQERIWAVFGEHNPAIRSNVFEKLHTIQIKKVVHTVKWAGPCLGEHDHPSFSRLLKVCTTSKRNDPLTPRNQLGRDRGCWGARPSHKLEWFYMAA